MHIFHRLRAYLIRYLIYTFKHIHFHKLCNLGWFHGNPLCSKSFEHHNLHKFQPFGPVTFGMSRRATLLNDSSPSQVSQVLKQKLASSVGDPGIFTAGKSSFIGIKTPLRMQSNSVTRRDRGCFQGESSLNTRSGVLTVTVIFFNTNTW